MGAVIGVEEGIVGAVEAVAGGVKVELRVLVQ